MKLLKKAMVLLLITLVVYIICVYINGKEMKVYWTNLFNNKNHCGNIPFSFTRTNMNINVMINKIR